MVPRRGLDPLCNPSFIYKPLKYNKNISKVNEGKVKIAIQDAIQNASHLNTILTHA